MSYFEDVQIGHEIMLGEHHFTEDAITAFARKYDPQDFHLNPDAARESVLGGLCASGWHTASVWMKLMVAHMKREMKTAVAEGRPMAALGPSPGLRDLKWIKPVYAGDTITYSSTIIAKHESRSKPDWGVIDNRNTGTNQNGELVFSFIGSVFIQRRPDVNS
ncbi:MaoC family dehydratase [Coralliovum pocilloporae]|uniref:MaoC family dehydratase n=1 Tax=Coralliovum pocilloporae TaxID=3066369 RepID=UPI0033075F50